MPSTVIDRLIYNADDSTLRIIYTSGAVYDYQQVPESVYNAMRSARSKGTFLNKEIKNKYSYKRLK